MRLGILPIIGIGALILGALRQSARKAIDQITVTITGIIGGLPPKIKIRLFNPTSLEVEITYIKIQILYKGQEIATLSNLSTRIIQPGNNDLTFELRPSLGAIGLLAVKKGAPKTISINWQVGTRFYEITGEKQTTL